MAARNSGIALAGIALLFSACNCDRKELSVALSPDGRLRATLSEENCGATADYSTSVRLESVSERDAAETVLKVRYRPMLTVRWNGSRQLVIEDHPCRDDHTPLDIVIERRRWREVEVLLVTAADVSCEEPHPLG